MKFTTIRPVHLPERGTPTSAGIDFFVPDDFNRKILAPQQDVLIPLGVKIKLEPGTAMVMMNKSGVATKAKLAVGACLIDEDYQGEVHAHVFNFSSTHITEITPGMKIVQGVIIPVILDKPELVPVDELYDKETIRGEGGFGSTNNA